MIPQLTQGNPFTEGLLALVAAENPELVAQAASSLGIPPPQTFNYGEPDPMLGQFLDPMMAQQMMQQMPQTNMANPGYAMGMGQNMQAMGAAPSGPGIGAPGAPAGGAGQPDLASMLQGFKAPDAVKPQWTGGVSGSQNAPTVGAGALSGGNQLMQMLMQSLNQRQATPPASLGQIIGR